MFHGGKWCIPGGYMEFDEDFLTAGRREVLEETGLEVRITSLLSVTSNFHTPEMASLSVVLLAEPVAGVAEPRDETQEVRWQPFSEPLPEMAFEHHEHIIQRYVSTRFEGAPIDPRYAAGPLT
jgi:ADP-ribose pyrophosphatase YjhB (NUDIX family)